MTNTTSNTTSTVYIPDGDSYQGPLAIMQAARRKQQPVLIWGKPGIGKTGLLEALAEREGMELIILIAATMFPEALDGIPYRYQRDDGTWIDGRTVPEWYQKALDNPNTIILFDELSGANRSMQNALLTFIHGRKLPGLPKLPDSVWILAAANDASYAAGGHILAAPMSNRFLHLDFEPEYSDWERGFLDAWGQQISPRAKTFRAVVATFLRSNTNYFGVIPEDSGRGWPSPRSWENAAVILAELSDSGAPDSGKLAALTGWVGQEAAYAAWEYFERMDLPETTDVLDDPDGFDWASRDKDWILAVALSAMAYSSSRYADVSRFLTSIAHAGHTAIGAPFITEMIQKVDMSAHDPATGKPVPFMQEMIDAYPKLSLDVGLPVSEAVRNKMPTGKTKKSKAA